MKKKVTKVPKFKDFRTTRATSLALEKILYKQIPILDHGFIRVIDYMGTDQSIVQAARVSYGEGTKKLREDRGLIRYLLSHWHTTPFEMCEIKFHIKLPIFVARQWIRHRTANVNEYSARYSVLDKEFYIPQPEHLSAQSTTNRQGRAQCLEGSEAERALFLLKRDAENAYASYQEMLNEDASGVKIDEDKMGLARELARMNLPVNYYTQWYWKIDLHNLLHFVSLRADSHAQYEIRAYANVLLDIVKKWTPLVYEAFEDYRLKSYELSGKALNVVQQLIKGNCVSQESSGMSLREWHELKEALDF